MLVAGFGLVLQLYNLPPITVLTRIAQGDVFPLIMIDTQNTRALHFPVISTGSRPYYHQRHTSIDPMSVSVYQWQRANTELWPVPLSLD